ncbi:Hypothetical protein PHPALM_36372 [Phytophthora palmivora]|uniref:Uncharacterized protein n=1 Tax=Phytophthora palmivora TaxID=4796 RepID=A0A2P4X044_9STRA|nr:Hypothetical protein PHPALM_36372 [Phytophthora palmivora]
MVSACNELCVKHTACLAHCLDLVVGGAMIKKKRRSGSIDDPEWASDAVAESSEHYLDETIASLRRNEIDALEGALVKHFTYLKRPDGHKEFKDGLLGPFAAALRTLSGQEYATMPLVLPALSGIRKHLKRVDLFVGLAAEAGDETYVAETVLMMNKCRTILLAL